MAKAYKRNLSIAMTEEDILYLKAIQKHYENPINIPNPTDVFRYLLKEQFNILKEQGVDVEKLLAEVSLELEEEIRMESVKKQK